MGFGGGGGDSGAGAAAADEALRQKRIREGMAAIETNFGGFTPEFFDKRQQDYSQWATPQVEDQFSKAREELTYALARQYGTLDTSETAERNAELAKQYDAAKTNVAAAAGDYATKSRADVEAQRNALVSQLQATTDPAAASTAAMRASSVLQSPEAFSPLGELFSGVTEGLAGGVAPYGVGDYTSRVMGNRRTGKPSSTPVNYVT